MKALERFKKHVMFLDDSDDSCWIWVGALRDDGRGRVRVRGKERRAHRVAWELLNGKALPRGMRLAQECNHPQCVRHWRIDRPNKKLSDEAIRSIRHSGLPSYALAIRWDVSSRHIRAIRCRMERASVSECTDITADNRGGRACA